MPGSSETSNLFTYILELEYRLNHIFIHRTTYLISPGYPELGFKIDDSRSGKSSSQLARSNMAARIDVTYSHNHETHWSQHCDL